MTNAYRRCNTDWTAPKYADSIVICVTMKIYQWYATQTALNVLCVCVRQVTGCTTNAMRRGESKTVTTPTAQSAGLNAPNGRMGMTGSLRHIYGWGDGGQKEESRLVSSTTLGHLSRHTSPVRTSTPCHRPAAGINSVTSVKCHTL